MKKNHRGEMGFMESMVSMMAVIVVIGLYLVFVTTSVVTAYSPLEDLDPESLIIDSPGGPEISESYAYMFVMNEGLKGMTITLSVPWFFEPKKMTIGVSSDAEYSQTFLSMTENPNGRMLPAMVEVRAFV